MQTQDSLVIYDHAHAMCALHIQYINCNYMETYFVTAAENGKTRFEKTHLYFN